MNDTMRKLNVDVPADLLAWLTERAAETHPLKTNPDKGNVSELVREVLGKYRTRSEAARK